MVIINVVTINSLKGKSLLDFSMIMFEIEIAEMPNRKAIIGIGKLRKMPNKANVGAKQTEQILIIDRIVAPAVDDTIAVSFAPNFSFRIEKIIEITIKIVISEAGIIKSH